MNVGLCIEMRSVSEHDGWRKRNVRVMRLLEKLFLPKRKAPFEDLDPGCWRGSCKLAVEDFQDVKLLVSLRRRQFSSVVSQCFSFEAKVYLFELQRRQCFRVGKTFEVGGRHATVAAIRAVFHQRWVATARRGDGNLVQAILSVASKWECFSTFSQCTFLKKTGEP